MSGYQENAKNKPRSKKILYDIDPVRGGGGPAMVPPWSRNGPDVVPQWSRRGPDVVPQCSVELGGWGGGEACGWLMYRYQGSLDVGLDWKSSVTPNKKFVRSVICVLISRLFSWLFKGFIVGLTSWALL